MTFYIFFPSVMKLSNSIPIHSLQGLSEQAVNAFRVMRAEGLKPSILVLNSLINAFGEDRRDAEAFAVLQYMKDNVGCLSYVQPLNARFLFCTP